VTRLREPGALERPNDLLEILFRTLQDPVHLRLMRWLLASERPAATHAFGMQDKGLAVIAGQVAQALAPDRPELVGEVETTLLTAVAAAYGYAIAKEALVGALGRRPSRRARRSGAQTVADMVQMHIRSKL